MDGVMDGVMGIVWKLAVAFFNSFAHAVTEYPLPTAAVFLISFFWVWPDVKARYADAQKQIVAAIIQFVLTVFAANVVGWLFNTSLAMAKFLFGATIFSTSIFVEHPIEFLEHSVAWAAAAAVILLYAAHWRLGGVRRHWLVIAIFPVIWVTYISANVHTHLVKGGTSAAPSVSSGKS